MKNKLTRRARIIQMLRIGKTQLTCGQICKKLIEEQELTGNVAHYLSGSVSSILAKLVKEGVVKYSDKSGPRGGHVYQKNVTNE